MFHSGRPRSQKIRAAFRDNAQLSSANISVAQAFLTFETFSQSDRYRTGHRLAGQSGQLCGESAGFVILDVETHRKLPRQKQMFFSTLHKIANICNNPGSLF